MHVLRGTPWGPRPLPELLVDQLADHGFTATDAGECARQINDSVDAAETASLFVDLGACKFLEGDVDGAIASWRHALGGEHDDAAARALFDLGLLYEHLHLHEQAIAVLESAEARGVSAYESPAVMASARCHQAAGNTDAAMELMARLAQSEMAHGSTSETLTESLFGLGEIAAEAGRFDRAERAWRAASAGAPSAPQAAAAARLMALLLDRGHDEEMLDLLAGLPDDLASLHAPALIARVQALHRLGSDEQASALAMSIDGAVLAAGDRFRLADVRRQVGLINEAIDELEVLLAHADVDVQQRAAFSLGEIYRSHSMPDAAVTMYERAVHKADRFWAPKAALALGDLWAEQDDLDKAIEQWSVAESSTVATVSDTAADRLQAARAQPASEPQVVVLDDVGGEAGDPVDAAEASQPQVVVLDDSLVPEQTPRHQPEAEQAEPEDTQPEDTQPEDAEPRDTQPEDTQPEDAEPEDTQPEDTQPEDAEPEDTVPPEPDLSGTPTVDAAIEVVESKPVEPQVVVLEEEEPAEPADEAGAPRRALLEDVADLTADDADQSAIDERVRESGPVSQPVLLDAATADEPSPSPDEPPAEPPADPHVIVLAALEESTTSEAGPAPMVEPTIPDEPLAAAPLLPTASAFRTLSHPNPYAALAPEGFENDVIASSQNPYAELAPNFDTDEPPVPSDVEPGDWESILEDWPRNEAEPSPAPAAAKKKKGPSAFSRYT